MLRYVCRLGLPADRVRRLPGRARAGLRGDWACRRGGVANRPVHPYERALELAESGRPEETIEAVRLLDALGAQPAATLVRRRLRELGVTRMPRRLQRRPTSNTAGLTARQVEILRLVATGLSNAEIARRLVVSTRTVDHHVSAVFAKLGVHSRREAARLLESLDLVPSRPNGRRLAHSTGPSDSSRGPA